MITHKYEAYLKHLTAVEKARRKEALQRFSSSCMSTSKWCRLFADLPDHLVAERCSWELIQESEPFDAPVPCELDLEHGAYEFKHGFFVLKDVEWVHLVSPDPAGLREALSMIGKFELEETASGLKVFGYR
jgi:hypothetical protein